VNEPCQPCQREGGYVPVGGHERLPPAESVPPYTGKQFFDDGKPLWPYEPMCPRHARLHTEARWAAQGRVVAPHPKYAVSDDTDAASKP
jgi:hypothetical protein